MQPGRLLLMLISTIFYAQAAPWSTCSLNGFVNGAGNCVCNTPWTGSNCSVLARMPALPGAAYGVQPNVSSWGGNVLQGDDGLYHMFVVSNKTSLCYSNNIAKVSQPNCLFHRLRW